MKDVVAIACSDIHLCHKAPLARSNEPDWYKAMERVLNQLRALQELYDCPIIIPGDIFDSWKAPIELVNFAIAFLPNRIYAVPGNHDLRFGSWADLRKSPFWTLMKSGKVELIMPQKPLGVDTFVLHGFPDGFHVKPNPNPHSLALNICVAHQYIWTAKTGYPNAPDEFRLKNLYSKLKGYNVAIFGDNHKGFINNHEWRKNDNWLNDSGKCCSVLNCGTLIRRKADEQDYKPSVGLILGNGNITRHFLDVSDDLFLDRKQLIKMIQRTTGGDLKGFLEELNSLGDSSLNFVSAVKKYMKRQGVKGQIKRDILEAIGD